MSSSHRVTFLACSVVANHLVFYVLWSLTKLTSKKSCSKTRRLFKLISDELKQNIHYIIETYTLNIMVEIASDTEENQDIKAVYNLLDEINTSTQNVASIVHSLIEKIRDGELDTSQGLSFLETKNHLLLSYLMNSTYLISRKVMGKKIENDPCVERLVEIRTVLEKIRPIDQKLKFQIDRLVKTGSSTDATKKFKPNLANLKNEEEDESEEDGNDEDEDENDEPKTKTGKYVPPKLSAVHYPGDENAFQRNKRLMEKSKKHALSSSILQDLCEEYLDTPMEVHQGSRAQQIMTKQQRERQEYEEEYMTRLPVSKAEKHQNKKLTTLGVLGSEITDYRDPQSQSKNNKKRKLPSKSKGKGFKRKKFSH